MVDPSSLSSPALFRRLVSAAKRYEALFLNGSGAPLRELAAAAAIGRRRRPPAIVIADCVWGRSGSRADRLATGAGMRALDGAHVHYCVHSREQADRFPELWRVDAGRVHVTPYYYTLSEEELVAPVERDGSVFAGGDSHRDYRALIEAARRMPETRFVLATGRIPAGERLPANVSAGRLSHDDYTARLRSASAVVVALQARDDRSAGEQTYLNAMVLGKPVVVTDTMGVREYVQDRETGLVVPPGDPDRLTGALHWALDPANEPEVTELTGHARETTRSRFGPDRYVSSLLRVLDDVLGARPSG